MLVSKLKVLRSHGKQFIPDLQGVKLPEHPPPQPVGLVRQEFFFSFSSSCRSYSKNNIIMF